MPFPGTWHTTPASVEMKHPVSLRGAKRGVSDAEGENRANLQPGLEVLARAEFHAFGSLDFDLFTRLRVNAEARLALHDLESAEADELHRFAFPEAALDAVDHGFDGPF